MTNPGAESTQSVTIVVSPRERFSSLPDSLRSLFKTIPADTRVIVVEGCSPEVIRDELRALQNSRPFEWIKTDYYITPQEARNLGMDRVQTKYVVFTDNDIHYQHRWLDALLANARKQGSDLVAPLICIGPPEKTHVHHAGGRLVVTHAETGRPFVSEKHRHMDDPFDAVSDQSAPVDNQIVEFHCFLARTEYVRRAGNLDERYITREQVDLGLRAAYNSAKVTFERQAVVTSAPTPIIVEKF